MAATCGVQQPACELLCPCKFLALFYLHPSRAIRNAILELSVSIFDVMFCNFGGLFGAIIADWGPSGPRQPAPDGFPDLRRPHESSGAYLGACFRSFSREV